MKSRQLKLEMLPWLLIDTSLFPKTQGQQRPLSPAEYPWAPCSAHPPLLVGWGHTGMREEVICCCHSRMEGLFLFPFVCWDNSGSQVLRWQPHKLNWNVSSPDVKEPLSIHIRICGKPEIYFCCAKPQILSYLLQQHNLAYPDQVFESSWHSFI